MAISTQKILEGLKRQPQSGNTILKVTESCQDFFFYTNTNLVTVNSPHSDMIVAMPFSPAL